MGSARHPRWATSNRRVRSIIATAAGAAVMVGLTSCSTGDGRTLRPPVFPPPATVPASTTDAPATLPPDTAGAAAFGVVAPFPDLAMIPQRHTCDGDNVAPALSWFGVPDGTVELAVTVVDLDARGYVHWLVYAIQPEISGFAEGNRPPVGVEGLNSAGSVGWTGPCPPPGNEHLYQFTVHALDQPLDAAPEATSEELIARLNTIATDQASVNGIYTRDEP